jgi:uncharacterized repeat protein (TIGR03803 family)
LTTLVNFTSANNGGYDPVAGLIADSSGNLYGTTAGGGSGGYGTVFELSGPNHATLTTLANFNGANGKSPQAGLLADSSGNLYGTTREGGSGLYGTVFELSGPNHTTLTTLANFNLANGGSPQAGLLADSSGNLYGTTSLGGSSGAGTVFELSGPNHTTLTTLVNFNGANGADPVAGLIADKSGNLYGTTHSGGSGANGTVFELSGPNHTTLTTLVNFNGANGQVPAAGLIADSSGNLYGTTLAGGSGLYGTVFELSGPNHTTLTTLANFDRANGQYPQAGLVADSRGNLYGTTSGGPRSTTGTVFELSPATPTPEPSTLALAGAGAVIAAAWRVLRGRRRPARRTPSAHPAG